MSVGDPGKEQFRNAITEFRNSHIMAALTALIQFRSQIVGNDEFQQRGGLDTTTQQSLLTHLQQCDKWRRTITYAPNRESLEARVKKAIDTTELIGGTQLSGQPADTPLEPSELPFGGDEVETAPGQMLQLPWAIDGSAVDLPLNSVLNFRSGNGFVLLQAVDAAFVAWTRLESRMSTRFITIKDSLRMYAHYVQILEYLLIFAGDKNVLDFPAGVLPSEEPRGAENAPNLTSEVAGASGLKSAA